MIVMAMILLPIEEIIIHESNSSQINREKTDFKNRQKIHGLGSNGDVYGLF